jgi:uncharacterized protein YbaR (Trm112 family)
LSPRPGSAILNGMNPGEARAKKPRSGVDKDLLEWLACPDSRQPLAEAGADLLARVNERVRRSEAKTVAGKRVEREVEAGLVRQDGKVLYPIVDGIPVLLVDEGIAL